MVLVLHRVGLTIWQMELWHTSTKLIVANQGQYTYISKDSSYWDLAFEFVEGKIQI